MNNNITLRELRDIFRILNTDISNPINDLVNMITKKVVNNSNNTNSKSKVNGRQHTLAFITDVDRYNFKNKLNKTKGTVIDGIDEINNILDGKNKNGGKKRKLVNKKTKKNKPIKKNKSLKKFKNQ